MKANYSTHPKKENSLEQKAIYLHYHKFQNQLHIEQLVFYNPCNMKIVFETRSFSPYFLDFDI